MLIEYGNGVRTSYEYDPLTFRLVRLRTTRPIAFNGLASQLLSDPDRDRSDRVMQAMLRMKKIDIASLQRAAGWTN